MRLVWPVPVSVFCAVLVICIAAAGMGVRRMARIEPAIVFRG
jgi:hypothetical protein